MTSPDLQTRLDQTLAWLCGVPSVITREGPLCDSLESHLSQMPNVFTTRVGNSLIVAGPRVGRPLIGLFGHLDTVPAHPDSGPLRFEDTPDGRRFHGLGASDMKAGLAIMWTLLKELDLGSLPYDVVMVFYDQEEGPYDQNGLGPVLEELPWLQQIDLAFALEPSDNVAQVGAVGTLHANIVFEGQACHSARPWQGDNAVHKAGALLSELAQRQPVEADVGGHRFREVMSVTQCHGGRARNIIPERFELNLNYRFAPGKSVEQAKQDVRDLVAERARVEFVDLCPSGRVVTADNPLFAHFLATTGAAVTAKQAWTDVARLGEANIDAVNFGPGNAAQAHQCDEYIDLPLLYRGYDMFHRFLTTAPG